MSGGGRVAAVVFDRSVDVDAVLGAAVRHLRRNQMRVGGQLQHFGDVLPSGKRSMWVEDIASGRRRRIDLPRGPGATGCTLDADALARAAYDLRETIRGDVDLIVVNRFGASEAEGGGMRAEIAEALLSERALLIAVRDSLLADWQAFLGRPGDCLAPDLAAILAWIDPQLALVA